METGPAVTAGDLRATLSALARSDLQSGRTREEVISDLESLRARARLSRHREEVEDAILDVMDRVYGWCGPNARI
jgi:hypothetical protein